MPRSPRHTSTMASSTDKGQSMFSSSVQQLTLKLLREFPRAENVFYSPFSIATVLAMVRAGADNVTLSQLSAALGVDSQDDSFYESLHTYMGLTKQGYTDIVLCTANKLYPSAKKDILEEFIKRCSDVFHSDVETVNFDKAEEVRNQINKWVESQTNEKIKELLPKQSLNDLTVMVLVNAIYFKGYWDSKFDKKSTNVMTFTTSKTKLQVDMMYQSGKFGYLFDHGNQFRALELPYKGKDLAMVILLPNTDDGLDALEQKLDSNKLKEVFDGMPKMKVKVWLPKFRMEFGAEMKVTLKSLGIVDAFHKNDADFSKMSLRDDVYLDEVYHKAFVEVNEEGTEAAAATAAVMRKSCVMISHEEEFKADHPFLFFIRDIKNDVILFTGRMMEPPVSSVKDKQKLEL